MEFEPKTTTDKKIDIAAKSEFSESVVDGMKIQ